MFGPPVDLSFKNISALTESWKMEPTRGLRPLRRDSDRKYSSRSLRLSNNNIKDLHDLFRPINHFLSEPSLLSWLDLSFNQISHIHSVLCELRELRVLYLHANAIFIMSEVYVLAALPHLHTVTLHGNVIETEQGYRSHVIYALPRLKCMDFSAVTPQERVMARYWHQGLQARRTTEEPDDL